MRREFPSTVAPRHLLPEGEGGLPTLCSMTSTQRGPEKQKIKFLTPFQIADQTLLALLGYRDDV